VLANPPNKVTANHASRFLPINAAQRGKSRIVKAGAHTRADDQPGAEICEEILRESEDEQPRGEQHRAHGEHEAAAPSPIVRPTCGRIRPATSRSIEMPPMTQSTGQPVSPAMGIAAQENRHCEAVRG
jgi:hypothetical protein